MFAEMVFELRTDRTITDPSISEDILKTVRERGNAINDEELARNAVGRSPVFDQ